MKKFLYWSWLILSILMIPAGICAIVYPETTLISLAWIIGLIVLIDGFCTIMLFALEHNFLFGAGWLLLDGVITVVLAVFLLFNNLFTASALPYVFGMWVIISGVQKAIYSFDLKKIGISGWGWVLAFGILSSAVGIVALTDPVVSTIAISVLVGWMLITYGVSSIILWSRVHKVKSFVKDAKKVIENGGTIEITNG